MIRTATLLRLRNGEVSFDSFAREHRADFVRLAMKLMSSAPSWLDVDDVVQEMMIAIPTAIAQWREGDYQLKKFIVFRTCAAGRKLIKRARDYQVFEARTDLDVIRSDDIAPPSQHAKVEVHEHVNALIRELPETDMEQAVMESLARTQCVERSMDELISDPRTRVMFMSSDDLVRRRMQRVMSTLAARAEHRRMAKRG